MTGVIYPNRSTGEFHEKEPQYKRDLQARLPGVQITLELYFDYGEDF